jgi:HEAT repeat protein
MISPVTASAELIVETLIHGRQAERMEAQRQLEEKAHGVNLDLARQLILDALSGKCAPRQQDDSSTNARCWLLSSLGLVPCAGNEPEHTLLCFVDENHEWAPWPRYWALQALVHRSAPGLEKVCRDKLLKDKDILPRFLAKAVLAATGDQSCAKDLKHALSDDSRDPAAEAARWAVLRALRFVYLPFAVEPVADIVNAAARNHTFGDVTFDAIVALGNVPRGAGEANDAANALINIITHSREFQYWDVMRIRAIEALGKLRMSHTASLLLDEVTDRNPSIVKEAVLALEQVLDAETMTARILERLAKDKDRETTLRLYANALRFLSDDKPAVNRLESAMVSGPIESREYARRLLSEMGGGYAVDKLTAQAQGAERYLQVLNDSDRKLREMFEGTIEEGRRGFRIVTIMDVTLFIAGLIMLGLAIGLAAADKTLVAVLTASGGILSALYGRFFAKPREQIEASVTHLATLKAIFLGYLRQLHQIDQTYARRMLDKEAPDAAEAKAFTELVESVTDSALVQLGTHKGLRRVRPATEATEEPQEPAPESAKGAAADK